MSSRIAARRFGPTGAVPLVALPGLNDGLAPPWVVEPPPPPPPFAEDQVVVLSFPDPVPSGATTASLAGELGAYLAREVGPCVVSGHSMGAMVALHLAADRPDLVRGLVLGAALARSDRHLASGLARWERWLRAGRFREFHRDALQVAYTGPARRQHLRLLDADPPPDPAEAAVARHLALSHAARRHDATGRLREVAAPTLVLAGEHDVLTRPERSHELARSLPDARFELIPGVAHGFPEQAAERYTAALHGFIHGELKVGETA